MQAQAIGLGRIINHDNDRGPLTLKALIAKLGLKVPAIKSAKYHQAQFAKRKPDPYRIPDDRSFQHRVLIERQSPLFHFESPDCIGDTPQFSSRGLTDWYVAEFCKLNHLRSQ